MNNNSSDLQRLLSAKERAILHDLTQGMTVKEIARKLGLSYQSVFNKLSNARRKTNARTTFHLIYLFTCSLREPISQETHHDSKHPQIKPRVE